MKKLITLTAIIFIGLFSGCANQATIKDLVKAEVQSQIKVALNNYEVGRDYIEKNKTARAEAFAEMNVMPLLGEGGFEDLLERRRSNGD